MKQTAIFSLAIVAAIATSSLTQAGDNFILRNSERSWDRFNQQQNFNRLYEQNERAIRQQRFDSSQRTMDRFNYGYGSAYNTPRQLPYDNRRTRSSYDYDYDSSRRHSSFRSPSLLTDPWDY
jgi:hypothetical protein